MTVLQTLSHHLMAVTAVFGTTHKTRTMTFSTVTGSFEELEATLKKQPWWGSRQKAAAALTAAKAAGISMRQAIASGRVEYGAAVYASGAYGRNGGDTVWSQVLYSSGILAGQKQVIGCDAAQLQGTWLVVAEADNQVSVQPHLTALWELLGARIRSSAADQKLATSASAHEFEPSRVC
ncbi:hypothetical protein [Leptolyngbya iicbica]|uniref:Uncharacterized protein n=2 Tax=Cyanophyceae TaxID=3028117 RepID=A0A4V2E236_9CYAN|nr:hypothetical protein [Leptolyngbya sp. LK]RZM76676.1 hypothetical protein DYY88_18665 [Leptolyngbya sp. LK]